MFDELLYHIEMTRLVRDAVDALRRDHPIVVIYSVSIWTDPNAARSAVSVDSQANSVAKLDVLTTWARARQAEALAAGDPEMAVLLGTLPPRNRNPAEFALREIASVQHRAFAPYWEAVSRWECWRELGAALTKVRAEALEEFGNLALHPDAELAVNSLRDWYADPVTCAAAEEEFRMAELEHSVALIRAFIAPERQERFLALLASERGRDKLRRTLAHFDALDMRYARRVASAEHMVEGIARALRNRGAPAECVLLAEEEALDGRRMALDEALRAVIGRGMGAFISCVPGRLAYFEGESVGERYLLERAG